MCEPRYIILKHVLLDVKSRKKSPGSYAWCRRRLQHFVYIFAKVVEIGETRVANRPGMAGTVPELTSAVLCPGLTRICTGIVCYCQLALLTSAQLIVVGLPHYAA